MPLNEGYSEGYGDGMKPAPKNKKKGVGEKLKNWFLGSSGTAGKGARKDKNRKKKQKDTLDDILLGP